MLKRASLFAVLFLLGTMASGIAPNLPPYQEVGCPASAALLKITVQPVDQSDCKGNKATFSVVAEGGMGVISYRWKRKRPADVSFLVFGAKDSTKLPVYNIGVGSEAPSGTQYQVEVINQNDTLVSAPATLTVNQITGIAPTGVSTYTVDEGSNLWFRALTSGNVPSGFQWIKKFGSGDWRDLTDNATISGSLEEQLNFTQLLVSDSGLYRLRVTFPTINGNHCVETSTITRKIYVTPVEDKAPPVFLHLINRDTTFCPEPLETAGWSDPTADIQPARTNFYRLPKFSTLFDLPVGSLSDNVTPAALLILHWGMYATGPPYAPLLDEAGTPLDNKSGQLSLHPESIRLKSDFPGIPACQIVFWLEDRAGNLTPDSLRHRINVSVAPRPEITGRF